VVLMPAELDTIAERLAAALGADRPAAIVSQATTADQQVVRGPIGGIAAAARAARLQPPSTLVVGDVVDVLSNIDALSPVEREAFAEALASPG
jgi:uroporphyrin-III C-methyltransferase